ncbi:MAG: hypothetical protein HND48_21855 [Chloroflexi bacterium]|nr:hypothetical protein [Chloroflexota bacterium]
MWAVPYIGDLVGTRLLSPYNPRGQRIDVAKTIYRRRAGTLRVLEEPDRRHHRLGRRCGRGASRRWAARSITLDLPPTPRGRLTATPPGGLADLRRADGSALAGGPFDEYFHTPDIRRARPYGIPKLVFHLYRLGAVELTGVEPNHTTPPGRPAYTFDPSGRDIPLMRRARPDHTATRGVPRASTNCPRRSRAACSPMRSSRSSLNTARSW